MRYVWCVAVFAAVGCGRAQGEAELSSPADAALGDSGPGDAVPSDPGVNQPRCDPAQPFQAPVLVPELNSPGSDYQPRLTADELELFFASDRDGKAGDYALFHAVRARRDEPFSAPVRIIELGSTNIDVGPFIASDNLTLYFHQTPRIAVTRRPTRDTAFGAPQIVANINSTESSVNDSEPYLTQGDRVMYFPSTRNGNLDLYRSLRNVDGSFAAPTPVSELNTRGSEADPTPAADDLSIYWAVSTADDGIDIWHANRPTTAVPFGDLERDAVLSSPANEYPGWLSPDGCVLYLASSRPGGKGMIDIWLARRPR